MCEQVIYVLRHVSQACQHVVQNFTARFHVLQHVVHIYEHVNKIFEHVIYILNHVIQACQHVQNFTARVYVFPTRCSHR
jgi:hypothetical protein